MLPLILCLYVYFVAAHPGWRNVWMDPLWIDAQCTWLVQSFANEPFQTRLQMALQCNARYQELTESILFSRNGLRSSTDLCVLDLDNTLLAHIPADTLEQRMLTQRIRTINNRTNNNRTTLQHGAKILKVRSREILDLILILLLSLSLEFVIMIVCLHVIISAVRWL